MGRKESQRRRSIAIKLKKPPYAITKWVSSKHLLWILLEQQDIRNRKNWDIEVQSRPNFYKGTRGPDAYRLYRLQ